MLQEGILNPAVNDLLSRIRHTNTLVIADWAFPYWNEIEVIDLSLTKGIPLITDLLEVLAQNFKVGQIWQAEEFLATNTEDKIKAFDTSFAEIPDVQVTRLGHNDLKKMVPQAIGLIRTGDATPYGNIILESV